MESQKKPLLIRPCLASKTSPKNQFCSKSLPTMGASPVSEFLCAFAKFVQKFTNLSQKPVKSYTKLGQSQRKAQINAFISHSYKFWLF